MHVTSCHPEVELLLHTLHTAHATLHIPINYLSLSASHICLLHSSLQSICLRIAFECHFGVILHSHHTITEP